MKWQSLTYHQKVKLLIACGIVLLVLCYQYGIKKTWSVYSEYTENKNKAEQAKERIFLLPSLETEEKRISNLIKKNLTDTLNAPKETLAFITNFCKSNQLKLTEYLPMQITENNHFNITTRQITIEGSYTHALMLLYELENRQSLGRLSSANFKGTEDPFTNNITLSCTFYLQNLIYK